MLQTFHFLLTIPRAEPFGMEPVISQVIQDCAFYVSADEVIRSAGYMLTELVTTSMVLDSFVDAVPGYGSLELIVYVKT